MGCHLLQKSFWGFPSTPRFRGSTHREHTHFVTSFGMIRIRLLLQRLLYQYTLLLTTRRPFVHRNKETKYRLGFVPIFNKNVTIAFPGSLYSVSPFSTSLLPGTCLCTVPWTDSPRARPVTDHHMCAALSMMRPEVWGMEPNVKKQNKKKPPLRPGGTC